MHGRRHGQCPEETAPGISLNLQALGRSAQELQNKGGPIIGQPLLELEAVAIGTPANAAAWAFGVGWYETCCVATSL
jgi:hypothetical protein